MEQKNAKEIFLQLEACICKGENFKIDKFLSKLQHCITKLGFNVDFEYAQNKELEKLHTNRRKIHEIRRTLFHVAIKAENYLAAEHLVLNGACPFKNIISEIKIITWSNDKTCKSIETLSQKKQDLLKQLQQIFNAGKQLSLKEAIINNALHKLLSYEYGENEFERLIENEFFEADHVRKLYQSDPDTIIYILKILQEYWRINVANNFVAELIVARKFNRFPLIGNEKDALIEELKVDQNKLSEQEYKLLRQINYLTQEDEIYFILAKYFKIKFSINHIKTAIIEDLKHESPGLLLEDFTKLLDLSYFTEVELQALCVFYREKASALASSETESYFRFYLHNNPANDYHANLMCYLQVQEDFARDMAMAEYSPDYSSNEEDPRERRQASDYEIDASQLYREGYLISIDLEEAAVQLQEFMNVLQAHWPEEKNFKYLTIEFHDAYKRFKKVLKKCNELNNQIEEINSKFENHGLSDYISPLDSILHKAASERKVEAHKLICLDNILSSSGVMLKELHETSPLSLMALITDAKLEKSRKNKVEVTDKIDPNELLATEYKKQQYVNTKFFRVKPKGNGKPYQHRDGKNSAKIFNEITKFISSPNQSPIALEGYAARSVIIALARLLNRDEKFPANLTFLIGETQIAIISKSTLYQVGNGETIVLNEMDGESLKLCRTYGNASIHKWLNNVTNGEPAREKKLAELLSKKSATIKTFHYSEFNNKNLIKLEDEDAYNPHTKTEGDRKWLDYRIHFLNHLNFLKAVFEVVRRLYRDDKGHTSLKYDSIGERSDTLPVGSAQARTSKLLQSGDICMQDAFGNSTYQDPITLRLVDNNIINYQYNKIEDRALYGAVTGITSKISTNSEEKTMFKNKKIALAERKIELINSKYRSSFLNSNHTLSLLELTKVNDTYNELKAEFGSGNETDSSDSDYDDAKAMNYK